VHWVPLVASLVAAAAITPTTIRGLVTQGMVRDNYRGASVAFPAGIALLIPAFVALVVVGPLYQFANSSPFVDGFDLACFFVFGVAVLGLIDDFTGSREGQPRGWRGHFGALAHGQLSTGILKAVGVLGLALFLVPSPLDPTYSTADYLLSAAVLVLATNVFNLIDLRPGRAIKALALLGAGLSIASGRIAPLQAVSLFLGPILVLLPLDLREAGMLGDTGSNVVGAVAGVWLILTLDTTLALAIAAGVLALITLYGEFRSISAFIERTPGFRQLDLLGRSHA
jgi:UDP-N-acetylmuramyl pentapeptide phosphotransferase/UDP-N-acetylglucosamine-1-phosphate transferase